MKFKVIIAISAVVLSSSLFAANHNTISQNKTTTIKAPKFVEFNPNNSYSFKIYERGTVVSYNSDEYKALRAINNNDVPSNNTSWEKISVSA